MQAFENKCVKKLLQVPGTVKITAMIAFQMAASASCTEDEIFQIYL